jgi:hypothetical protein
MVSVRGPERFINSYFTASKIASCCPPRTGNSEPLAASATPVEVLLLQQQPQETASSRSKQQSRQQLLLQKRQSKQLCAPRALPRHLVSFGARAEVAVLEQLFGFEIFASFGRYEAH